MLKRLLEKLLPSLHAKKTAKTQSTPKTEEVNEYFKLKLSPDGIRMTKDLKARLEAFYGREVDWNKIWDSIIYRGITSINEELDRRETKTKKTQLKLVKDQKE